MGLPRVSIIVPVYNVENYLDKCIQSILCQTFRDFELILIDDGSSDNSGIICEKYKEKDRRIITIHKENGGQSEARNLGLESAKGNYILFVDSDDFIKNDLLEQSIYIAEKENVDIVFFDMVEVDDIGNKLTTYKLNVAQNQKILIKEHPEILVASPSPVNKLYRRELFFNTGIRFPKGFWYEDLRTIPKIVLKANSIFYLKETKYYYLIRSGSTMRNNSIEKNYNDRTSAINDLISYFKINNLYDKYYKELEAITALQGYFYPCREIIGIDYKSIYLDWLRIFIDDNFPDFNKNSYLKQISPKEKIIFCLLFHKQYWIILAFSKILKFVRG